MPRSQKLRTAALMEVEAEITRSQHALVVRAHGRWGGMPERHLQWHYDLRRKKNRIVGSTLRWIDAVLDRVESLADLDDAERDLRLLPMWIAQYITAAVTELRGILRRQRAFGAWTHDGTEIK
jgi:hypothetical protein